MNMLASTLLIGAGATAMMDLWGIVRKPLLGLAPPDYGLVGRWIAHMAQGQFGHRSIAALPPVNGERIVGWTSHYLIGIAFAAVLTGVWGTEWVENPTMGPALVVGIGSVLAPFLVMQPGMGAGIAASRTPNPGAARLQSLITHAVYGLGLFATGRLLQLFLAS